MSEYERLGVPEDSEQIAGADKFERSENLSAPAAPPVGPGVPPTTPPSGGVDPDDAWEDDWPTGSLSHATGEGAESPDSLSWERTYRPRR